MTHLNAVVNRTLSGLIVLFLCSNLFAQKPKVAIVVWDGHAKEGQNVGIFRLYQIGDVTPGLNVKIKGMRTFLPKSGYKK